jgi:hypothetical protein
MRPREQSEQGKQGESKTRLSADIPLPLADRARNVVYFTPGETVAGLLVRGLELAVEEAERKHHGGKRFPARSGQIRTGRPVKA